MNRAYSAKKYFLAQFRRYTNNENKILVHKLFPGIRELLSDYIQINKDVIENIENNKFKTARVDMLTGMKFFLKESILHNHKFYQYEIRTLISKIDKASDKDINDYVKINNICTSFLKKLNNDNLYEYIVERIKVSNNFNDIDKILEELISELLYEGYSLKFLSEWCKKEIPNNKDINEENIDSIIDKFKFLKKNKEKYTYYLALNEDIGEEKYIDLNMSINRVGEQEITNMGNGNDKISKFILQGNRSYVYKITIRTLDMYKGLEIIKKSFESYFQIINSLRENKSSIEFNNKCIVRSKDNTYSKLRIENYDEDTLFLHIENREREEIEDFIRYRDKVYETMENVNEIGNLQRAINIVKSQKGQLQENRLINLWSVLEYILTFNEGHSIISNVKDIIPKVVCLYSIKDKINMFWNQLYKYKNSDIEIIGKFIESCIKDNDEYQYDINKLISFIQQEGESLIKAFEFNSVLQRNIGEIGFLINNKEARVQYIKKVEARVEYDVSRIYRSRNILIHSGQREIINIDCKSLRLYKYNSHLLALIIYYKSKNPYLTITEILNSIEHTYNDYIEKISNEDVDKLEICKPRYLFI